MCIGSLAHVKCHLDAQSQYCTSRYLVYEGNNGVMGTRVMLEMGLSGWLVNFPLPLRHLLCNAAVYWVGLGVVWDHANTLALAVSHSCKRTRCALCGSLGCSDKYLPHFSHLKDRRPA